MFKTGTAFAVVFLLLSGERLSAQEGVLPLRFEVMIDGESFIVDEGQITKLSSKAQPAKSHQVAVRMAQYQPWRLNTLQFDYHRGFAVTDDQAERYRTATLRHDLGFAVVLSDLDGPLDEAERKEALEGLLATTRKSLEASGAKSMEVSAPTTRKFGASESHGVVIKYQQGEVAEAVLVYVLSGPKFAASAVVQYLQTDQADVLDLIRPTLESLAPIP